jgi:hypothetical protein
MKCIRIPALLLATGAVAGFSAPATAQVEIDPDHFDQVGKAKPNGDAVKNQTAAWKTTDTKHQQKPSQPANKHPEGTRQAKAGNQPLSGRSKSE